MEAAGRTTTSGETTTAGTTTAAGGRLPAASDAVAAFLDFCIYMFLLNRDCPGADQHVVVQTAGGVRVMTPLLTLEELKQHPQQARIVHKSPQHPQLMITQKGNMLSYDATPPHEPAALPLGAAACWRPSSQQDYEKELLAMQTCATKSTAPAGSAICFFLDMTQNNLVEQAWCKV
ncbi:MAG: hypothetical protein FRX49_11420 [Trebouxia sp. A1-2]|nr:MAG: hypothetical protein FRX49_11420 [Trebouxia sp. A1-2]